MTTSLNRIQVSRSALRHNFSICQRQAGTVGVMAMVKAEGYGHGMEECARIFSACGAAAFGVAEVVDGVQLRQAGVTEPIFILAGILPELYAPLFAHDLTPVLVDGSLVVSLSQEAVSRGKKIAVHVKLDAGMGRQGCLPEELPALVTAIASADGLQLAGILAHFPDSDAVDSGESLGVLAAFLQTIQSLKGKIPPDCCVHIANSGALFSVDGAKLDMVRPGLALYGYGRCGKDKKYEKDEKCGMGAESLQPAMRFSSRVVQVREVPAGTGLGYGHTFTTRRKTRVAILPVGYEDGYLRSLSNKARVLLHGRQAPVVGRISMNLTMVDVTEIDGVQGGDEVVLLGQQGEERITADDIATWMGTISYEVLCLLGRCNRIEYVA